MTPAKRPPAAPAPDPGRCYCGAGHRPRDCADPVTAVRLRADGALMSAVVVEDRIGGAR